MESRSEGAERMNLAEGKGVQRKEVWVRAAERMKICYRSEGRGWKAEDFGLHKWRKTGEGFSGSGFLSN